MSETHVRSAHANDTRTTLSTRPVDHRAVYTAADVQSNSGEHGNQVYLVPFTHVTHKTISSYARKRAHVNSYAAGDSQLRRLKVYTVYLPLAISQIGFTQSTGLHKNLIIPSLRLQADAQ